MKLKVLTEDKKSGIGVRLVEVSVITMQIASAFKTCLSSILVMPLLLDYEALLDLPRFITW